MKIKTKRRLICSKCGNHIGYIEDYFVEKDWQGSWIDSKIWCVSCGDEYEYCRNAEPSKLIVVLPNKNQVIE